MKNYRKHLTPPSLPVARVVLACVFAVSLFSCKITTDEPDKFTVTFDANGGSGTIESITKTENEEFELPINIFTKNGFTFAGWNTKSTPDESSKSYKDKEKITLTENLTLYAQWKENSYKINYELNGGTNAAENPTTFKKSDNVILAEPTYEYFDFCGWYLTQDFSGEAISGWNAGEKIEAVTLYAKWTVKAENVVKAIENLAEGTHNICVVGEIDETTVKNIGESLRSNENAKVNLDLSGATGFESIPKNAFKCCISLTSIKIPEGVTSIEYEAFHGCENLTNVEIPKSVTSIGEYAFIVTGLKNIKLSNSKTCVGRSAFWECRSLTTAEVSVTQNGSFSSCSSLTTVKIIDGVAFIAQEAFANCTNLTTIEIPDSVNYIGSGAFSNCASLAVVIFKGSKAQWESIGIDNWNNDGNKKYLLTAKIICSDGIINE